MVLAMEEVLTLKHFAGRQWEMITISHQHPASRGGVRVPAMEEILTQKIVEQALLQEPQAPGVVPQAQLRAQ